MNGWMSQTGRGVALLIGVLWGIPSVQADGFQAVIQQERSMIYATAPVQDIGTVEGAIIATTEAGLVELLRDGTIRPWDGGKPEPGPAGAGGALNVQAEDGSRWTSGANFLLQHVPDSVSGKEKIITWTGANGLPVAGFTCGAGSPDHGVWFGTEQGVVRFSDGDFHYRQGRRWLPHDQVTDIFVDQQGEAWIATPGGVARIYFQSMSLRDKAEYYEEHLDRYIRRTDFGYVSEVSTSRPGWLNQSAISKHPSDNDGLWTSMYGAGECFAYAATRDPEYKRRAQNVFKALKFLVDVTRGGSVFLQDGYVARTVLESNLPDPNEWPSYTWEGMVRNRKSDALWKVYFPRWPMSADRSYYFKTDTSSDELDGHYFFYALYYDFVAETEQEKSEVASVVASITDHIVRNDFCLVDHDGLPTRWGVFSPSQLNSNRDWYHERGLNSLSLLTYLTIASHITGNDRYLSIIEDLVGNHHYLINAMVPKIQTGIGSGNQSDDEMAFMNFFNLIRLTGDAEIRSAMQEAFFRYWALEFPEVNPFFNYCYAAVSLDASIENQWGQHSLKPWDGWDVDAYRTLVEFPLDRFNWSHRNSHRLDIVFLPRQNAESLLSARDSQRGYRSNGKALPVSERFFHHWNTDPWQLDYFGEGTSLASGTVYLLPYYMGLYFGFLPAK